MQFKQDGNIYIVRLEPGEEIMFTLKDFCERNGITSASVLNGIGMLRDFEIGEFKKKGEYEKKRFEKPCELISLQGNIALCEEGELIIHVHACLANDIDEPVAGHLFEGTVCVTNEITILRLEKQLERRLDDETGLKQLFLK